LKASDHGKDEKDKEPAQKQGKLQYASISIFIVFSETKEEKQSADDDDALRDCWSHSLSKDERKVNAGLLVRLTNALRH